MATIECIPEGIILHLNNSHFSYRPPLFKKILSAHCAGHQEQTFEVFISYQHHHLAARICILNQNGEALKGAIWGVNRLLMLKVHVMRSAHNIINTDLKII